MSKVPQVLVIEPDREAAMEVQKLLSTAGFAVIGSAGYGVEAFALAYQLNPDAMLVRVDEPAVRAVQTITRIREGLPDTPFIAYTSSPSMRLVRQAMIAGAVDFLHEPLQPSEIEEALSRAIERKERDLQRRSGELDPPIPQGTVITVFGAKGGIGKTTIASNLAIALATEAQQSVALVDMDTRFGDVAITMDIQVERSIADLARNIDGIDRNSLREFLVQHESGVRILPAPVRPGDWRSMSSETVRDVVDVLAQTHDFVVLDTPGTFNEIVAGAIELASLILVVTTLELSSIKDTVLALEMLHGRFGQDNERIKVVLNRAGLDTGVTERDVEQALGEDLAWRLPHDHEVMRAAQMGRPIVMAQPNNRMALAVRAMARDMSGVRTPVAARRRSGGLLRGRFRKSA